MQSHLIAHRSAVFMATWAFVMVEEQSSSSLLTLSSLSCWAFSLWLVMSTIRLWSLFTSFSTFAALLDAASKSRRREEGERSKTLMICVYVAISPARLKQFTRKCLVTVYWRILPFLKASRLFSSCFCLALSGAAASTLASSSLILGFNWASWSARIWQTKVKGHTGVLRAKLFYTVTFCEWRVKVSKWVTEKTEYLIYIHAVGVFFQCVFHFSELRPQALDVLLQLQLSLLAALQLWHLLVQLALHSVKLQKTHESHHPLQQGPL